MTSNRPQPAPAEYGSLPGPHDITRVELPNGIVVLSRANFNSPSVVVHGYLNTGSIFDPDEKLGLADFVASALMRGVEKYTFQELYDQLESAGASLGVGGGTHTSGFHIRALSEDLDLLLHLLGQVLRRPTFPGEQVERLRAQLLTGLALRAQDTGEMASMAFDQIVYAGHPYSRPQDGHPETIAAIQVEDLVDFHRRTYGPQGAVIAIVGAVDPAYAVEKIAQTFGDWENPEQPTQPPLPPVVPLAHTVTQKISIPGKSQTDLLMGIAGPNRRAPEFLAASLGNHVLGQFGMMGRIGRAVRERAGLAYYAHSSLSGGTGPGPWYCAAGVEPANVEQTIEMIRQEIVRFTQEPVSEEELADSQANYIGRLPLSLESNGGVAASLINLERFDLGLDYYVRYQDLIRAITPAQVLEAARQYLDPDRLGIAIAG